MVRRKSVGNNISEFGPLVGMTLEELNYDRGSIIDPSTIKNMSRSTLMIYETYVSDLTPLSTLPLQKLGISLRLFHDADEKVLRSMPLKNINETSDLTKSAEQFWEEVETRRSTVEAFASETAKLPADDQVTAVVARLKQLNSGYVGHLDYEIESGAVTSVTLSLVGQDPRFIESTRDVTPLRAFSHLKQLTLIGGHYPLDLSPVNSLPLEELNCQERLALRNAPVLREMRSLKTINGKPAQQYLSLRQPSSRVNIGE